MNRALYPGNWEAISREVRESSGQRCQFCQAVNGQPNPVTGSRVVLTVAHLNHNPRDSRRVNLRALCQRCHLAYDAPLHRIRSSRTRLERIGRRQGFLLDVRPEWRRVESVRRPVVRRGLRQTALKIPCHGLA